MPIGDVLRTANQRYNTWIDQTELWNPTQETIDVGPDATMLDMLQRTNAENYLNPYWYDYYKQQGSVPAALAGLSQSRGLIPSGPGGTLSPEQRGNYYKAYVRPFSRGPVPGTDLQVTPQRTAPVLQWLLNELGSGQRYAQLPVEQQVDMSPDATRQMGLYQKWGVNNPAQAQYLQALLGHSVGGSPFANYLRQQMGNRLQEYQFNPLAINWLEYITNMIPGLGFNYRVPNG